MNDAPLNDPANILFGLIYQLIIDGFIYDNEEIENLLSLLLLSNILFKFNNTIKKDEYIQNNLFSKDNILISIMLLDY